MSCHSRCLQRWGNRLSAYGTMNRGLANREKWGDTSRLKKQCLKKNYWEEICTGADLQIIWGLSFRTSCLSVPLLFLHVFFSEKVGINRIMGYWRHRSLLVVLGLWVGLEVCQHHFSCLVSRSSLPPVCLTDCLNPILDPRKKGLNKICTPFRIIVIQIMATWSPLFPGSSW